MDERMVACTQNLWETSRWAERSASLRRFMELHRPDLLCVQELRPESLALAARPDALLLVSTAHFTWPGNTREKLDGVNIRIEQARRTSACLELLAPAPAPLLFMGDLNDHYHPIRILRAAGLEDCFSGLDRQPRATRPAAPTYQGTQETLDWIFYRGRIRPMTCEVVDFFHGDFAPSDHKPVLATFEITDGPRGFSATA